MPWTLKRAPLDSFFYQLYFVAMNPSAPAIVDRAFRTGLRFETPELLAQAVDGYFASAKLFSTPVTMGGLACAIGISRSALFAYGTRRGDEYGDIIAKAKIKIEANMEERLVGGQPATGVIFALKNGYGWRDKTEVEVEHHTTISLSTLFDEAIKRQALTDGFDKPVMISAVEDVAEGDIDGGAPL